MKRFWFTLLACLVFALPAFAANEGPWPLVLHAAACDDNFNAVAPGAGSGGISPWEQVSGTSDGFCDYDKRVRKNDITVDTSYGPIYWNQQLGSPKAIRIRCFAQTIGGAGTVNIVIQRINPLNPAGFVDMDSTATFSTAGVTYFYDLGLGVGATADTGTDDRLPIGIPEQFYIQINLGTATSWGGTLSIIPLY